MASTVNSIPLGQHTQGELTLVSFQDILEVRPLGRNEENDKECYWIKVKFAQGDLAFHTESKSLKTALEMIHSIGQQTENHTAAEFKTFVNSNQGKRIWFNMTNISKNPNFKTDQVTAYKRDRHGNSLEYAFTLHKHHNFRPEITIHNDVIAELKRSAKLHQMQPSNAVNSQQSQNGMDVHLRRKRHRSRTNSLHNGNSL